MKTHHRGLLIAGTRMVVSGIGMLPNFEAALATGLAEEGATPVDDLPRNADLGILAAGDCTPQHHALYGRQLLLESVPNPLEQARGAALWLCGKPKPKRAVPWFWQDQ